MRERVNFGGANGEAGPGDTLDACWGRIGVWGDRKCPELKECVHCRNCAVYSAAAERLLERPLPAGYRREWTEYYAGGEVRREACGDAVLIFRIGEEWLALAAKVLLEVTEVKPIHSVPHLRGGTVLGLANVRGALLICVSVAKVLGLDGPRDGVGLASAGKETARPRFLVLRTDGGKLALPVDEVAGTWRGDSNSLMPPPPNVARAVGTYTKNLLAWQGRTVGVLDDQLLFYTLNRSFA